MILEQVSFFAYYNYVLDIFKALFILFRLETCVNAFFFVPLCVFYQYAQGQYEFYNENI